MAKIREDELGTIIRPAFERAVQRLVDDREISESEAEAAIINRIASATTGGSETQGDGGDVLEPETVRQALSGSIENPSLNMMEGISEALGIDLEKLAPFAEDNQ